MIHVPANYPTIQQGLNAAVEHDTVLVSDGLYYENLIFPNINLTLASQYLLDGDTLHIANTILDGSQPHHPDSGSVVYMVGGGQDSTTVIAGLTLQNGTGTLNSVWWPPPQLFGGGCVIRQASPILEFNRFHSNRANYGGGLYLGTGADVLLRYNEIDSNYASGIYCEGGGLYGDSCALEIISNHIHHNFSDYGSGGMSLVTPDSIIIANNVFDHNRAIIWGAGFFANGYYSVTGNIVADNETNNNAGFHFGAIPYWTTAIVVNNQFLRNSAADSKAALSLASNAVGQISENLFQDNSAIWAAGLNLWEGIYIVSGNQFINNGGLSGGVIYVGSGISVDIYNNTITGCTGSPQYASAIFSYTNFFLNLHNNNIYGNSAPAVAPGSSSPYPIIDADSNWWGDPSGPYNPTLNPNGLGDAVGDGVLFDPWLTSMVVGVPPNPAQPPAEFRLYPPRPNPFNPTTTIDYQLPALSQVSLKVYDTAGRLIATLVNEPQPPGLYHATFDGSKLASGIYLYRLTAGAHTTMGKMVLLK